MNQETKDHIIKLMEVKTKSNAKKVLDLYKKYSGLNYKGCFCSRGHILNFYKVVDGWLAEQ